MIKNLRNTLDQINIFIGLKCYKNFFGDVDILIQSLSSCVKRLISVLKKSFTRNL
eukprot:UN29567